MTIIFQGMCFSGKSTLGKLVAEKLNIPFLDSRDLFLREYGISEADFLRIYGNRKFIMAEKKSIQQPFNDMVFSLGGSAIYYPDEMAALKDNYTIIWIDVPLNIILKRRKAEKKRASILYPDGIRTFEELYQQRAQLYSKYADYKISICDENEKPEITRDRIINLIASAFFP